MKSKHLKLRAICQLKYAESIWTYLHPGTVESSTSRSQQHQYHRFAVQPSKGLTTGETAALTGSGRLHKGMVKSRTSLTNQSLLSRERTTTEMSGKDCLYDRPAEPKTNFTHWPTHPSCSYTESDQDQDCMLVQSETVSSIRSSKRGREGASSTRTHAVRNAAEGSIREEERWNQAAILRQSRMEASGHISRPEVIQTETASRTSPSYFTVIPQIMSNLTQPGASLAGLQLPKHTEKGRRKSYVCKYCGKAFPGLSNVVAHQRVHTGERPFKCDTCGKLFTEAGNLKKHQRIHTGEKPFVCPRCGKRFAWICNLKTHQQSASCGGVWYNISDDNAGLPTQALLWTQWSSEWQRNHYNTLGTIYTREKRGLFNINWNINRKIMVSRS